jgi:hypothetical protein
VLLHACNLYATLTADYCCSQKLYKRITELRNATSLPFFMFHLRDIMFHRVCRYHLGKRPLTNRCIHHSTPCFHEHGVPKSLENNPEYVFIMCVIFENSMLQCACGDYSTTVNCHNIFMFILFSRYIHLYVAINWEVSLSTGNTRTEKSKRRLPKWA